MTSASLPCAGGWLAAALAACVAAGCSPPPPVAAPAAKPPASGHAHDHGHDHGHDHDHAKTDAKTDTNGSEHDDHEHPQTLTAGLAELETLTADLAEKLADDAGEAADDAVHGIAHLLEDLRSLARKEVADGAAAAATKALDELEECFGKVDEAFHTADDKADPPAKVLDTVKDRVEAAIKVLKEVVR
jgi:molecular chaperone GrpE (heat shock protein)